MTDNHGFSPTEPMLDPTARQTDDARIAKERTSRAPGTAPKAGND